MSDFNPYDGEFDEYEFNDVVCSYCRDSGLHWVEDRDCHWHLFNSDGTMHDCLDPFKAIKGL